MNLEEVKAKIAEIHEAAKKAERELIVSYLKETVVAKVGDIIETNCDYSIEVSNIKFLIGRYSSTGSIGCVIYRGVKLNKNGSHSKRENDVHVYSHSIKSINGIPYVQNT